MTEILRTAQDGCYKLVTNAWGTYLTKSPDPDATVEITDEQLESIEMNPDTPRIPAELWNRWLQLCFEMTKRDTRNLEVSCRLLRSAYDKTLYRILVPEQEVTGATVRVKSFDKAVDIATGEIVQQWPPEGWIPCGSSHSHNTMDAFFSGTDDAFEIGDPGLHVVVGLIDVKKATYKLAASITANNRRFLIEPSTVIDVEPGEFTTSYHPSVIDVITMPQPMSRIQTLGYTSMWQLDDYCYAPPLTTSNASSFSRMQQQSEEDYQLIREEVETVHKYVEKLKARCLATGVSIQKTLVDLSFDMEEMAYSNDRTAIDGDVSEDTLDDPFYWSSY